MRIRFAVKPGRSSDLAGVFFINLARFSAMQRVSSEVQRPLMISTKGITVGGYIKCMPMIRSGREVEEAILVIDREEVLVARIHLGGVTVSR